MATQTFNLVQSALWVLGTIGSYLLIGHLKIDIPPFSFYLQNETKLTSLLEDNCHPQTWTHFRPYCRNKYVLDKKIIMHN